MIVTEQSKQIQSNEVQYRLQSKKEKNLSDQGSCCSHNSAVKFKKSDPIEENYLAIFVSKNINHHNKKDKTG